MRHRNQKHWKGILIALAFIVLMWASWAWDWHSSLWDWLSEGDTDETNSATIRNISLIPISIVAFVLTMKRIKVAQRQARASEGSLRSAQEAVDLNYKTLSYTSQRDEADRLHNRYADASARLSSDSASARLGAIHEMEVLTDQDPEQLHVRTMKLLCAFVRFPPADARLDEVPDDDPCSVALRPDVQAAMEAIGSRTAERIRLEADAEYLPDMSGANLARLILRNANLSKTIIRGATFWGADLWRTNLSGCELQYADFSSPWVVRGDDLDEIEVHEGGLTESFNAT